MGSSAHPLNLHQIQAAFKIGELLYQEHLPRKQMLQFLCNVNPVDSGHHSQMT